MTHHATEMSSTDDLEITATYGTAVVHLRSRKASFASDEDSQTLEGGGETQLGDAHVKQRRAA
jgi:hypothetical protein